MVCIAVTKPCSIEVRERAQVLGCMPVVVSFEPLPRAYFSKEPVPRLSSVREKLLGFAASSMEHTLLLRFNQALTRCPRKISSIAY
jgi:riboflavin kinase/FMN adenylyltransferase